jgi:hypothetical protein
MAARLDAGGAPVTDAKVTVMARHLDMEMGEFPHIAVQTATEQWVAERVGMRPRCAVSSEAEPRPDAIPPGVPPGAHTGDAVGERREEAVRTAHWLHDASFDGCQLNPPRRVRHCLSETTVPDH